VKIITIIIIQFYEAVFGNPFHSDVLDGLANNQNVEPEYRIQAHNLVS